MKIVLWIGNEENQKALANKIHALYPITGIITETRIHKPKITSVKIFEKVIEKLFLRSIGQAWRGMKTFYRTKYSSYPQTHMLDVENINSEVAYQFTKELSPDLIIVSGTRLVKEKMLSLKPAIGILNLHTGLSPYIKGGPNCTNWCLATKQYHLIGNTIMWIDAGIDTGDIITTAFTEFSGDENLLDMHIKVMEHAHLLYVQAIEKLASSAYSNVMQNSITEGTTYYNKEWGLKEKVNMIKNLAEFRKLTKTGQIKSQQASVKTVKL